MQKNIYLHIKISIFTIFSFSPKPGGGHIGFPWFQDFPPGISLRTFFLSLRTYPGIKICWVCFCCNFLEVIRHFDCTKLVELISELYSGTENGVRCGGSISNLFAVVTGVHQGHVLAPSLFKACTDWILGKMSERSSCGASLGKVTISDLDFEDDAVILVETMDVFVGAFKALNEELELLGLRVFWVKTKIQAFNDILDAAILSVPVCGEDVEVTERFT